MHIFLLAQNFGKYFTYGTTKGTLYESLSCLIERVYTVVQLVVPYMKYLGKF